MKWRDDKSDAWNRARGLVRDVIRATSGKSNHDPAPHPVPPPVIPPSRPGIRIARIKDDLESPNWGDMSRTNWDNPVGEETPDGFLNWRMAHPKMAQAPQTVRVQLEYKKNGKAGPSQFRLPISWQYVTMSMNPGHKFVYLTRDGSGWVNRPSWPMVQALLFRRNLVPVEEVSGGRAYLWHYDLETTHITEELEYIQRFTVITEEGFTVDPKDGLIRMPLVFPQECRVWIPLDELVFIT